jgi:hypothetical protein
MKNCSASVPPVTATSANGGGRVSANRQPLVSGGGGGTWGNDISAGLPMWEPSRFDFNGQAQAEASYKIHETLL